ncbi:A/G-specific adenine glycosylase [Euzebyella marina]|uniref:Adenine DNA glycosylase n=1 Tax=Euzebyella marina TaxID=1761453 RepID=A0A3G2LB31_9FLAO|nr:A/G-specific adenine glycosylase [Euzebyella marina]AYN69457.1 A/G-specific adenine glycosylase [Euzebyella marina]
MTFANEILAWYERNKRDLPWRTTTNPYNIWLSEIMLQQTRVSQGLPYYQKFVENFPAVEDLAEASEEKVLKLWQGLGYYSRARNLHATAKMVAYEYDGQFPDTYKELLALKGVGDYTASAIASICFGRPEPVVDGNVYRVLSRYFGVDIPINSTEGVKYFKQLAREVMHLERIRDYNQGIMEFGAMQCVPQSPNCQVCPLSSSCKALKEGTVGSLPVKLKKTKVKTLYFNYLVPISKGGLTILEQRTDNGIWRNLWQFPLLESKKELELKELKVQLEASEHFSKALNVSRFDPMSIIHKLSHRHIHTVFWIIELNDISNGGIPFEKVEQYPVPVLIDEFLKRLKNSYFWPLNDSRL